MNIISPWIPHQHEWQACQVKTYVRLWEEGSLDNKLRAFQEALCLRVGAAVEGIFDSLIEVTFLAPRLILASYNRASSRRAELSTQLLYRVMYVNALVVGVFFAQLGCLALAATLPEFGYQHLKMHKQLFKVQREVFVESLSDFSDLNFCLAPVTQLWDRLGLDEREWREDVKRVISRQHFPAFIHHENVLGHVACEIIASRLAQAIDERFSQNELTHALERGFLALPRTMRSLIVTNIGNEALHARLVELDPTMLHAAQHVDRAGASIIRPLVTKKLSKWFLTQMKVARDELLKNGRHSQDAIASCSDGALEAVTSIGIVRWLDSATLSADGKRLLFQKSASERVALADEQQFFGALERLIGLKQLLHAIDQDATKKQALIERLSFSDAVEPSPLWDDDEVTVCFKEIVAFRIEVIERTCMTNRGLSEEEKIDWHDAFRV